MSKDINLLVPIQVLLGCPSLFKSTIPEQNSLTSLLKDFFLSVVKSLSFQLAFSSPSISNKSFSNSVSSSWLSTTLIPLSLSSFLIANPTKLLQLALTWLSSVLKFSRLASCCSNLATSSDFFNCLALRILDLIFFILNSTVAVFLLKVSLNSSVVDLIFILLFSESLLKLLSIIYCTISSCLANPKSFTSKEFKELLRLSNLSSDTAKEYPSSTKLNSIGSNSSYSISDSSTTSLTIFTVVSSVPVGLGSIKLVSNLITFWTVYEYTLEPSGLVSTSLPIIFVLVADLTISK